MELWTESAFSVEVDEGPPIVLETDKAAAKAPASLKFYL